MVGRTLSHYRVLEEIGRGGMGIVYRALDLKLNREVALKLLPQELMADSERKRRFIQEARAAAALDHPHIATVHEIDEAEGETFIVLELIRGEKLRDVLNARRLSVARYLELATEAAEGLARAHERGIVHRDLKPANIMVTEDGHAKIIDFGVAKLVEPLPREASELETRPQGGTTPGVVMGTASYMSPEQVRGEDVDPRSDIFSFGSVLCEMLGGRAPFERRSGIETVNAILNDPAPGLLSLGTGVSPEALSNLQRIVDKCLGKDAAERYQTMKDLAVDLRSVRRKLEAAGQVGARPKRLRLAWTLTGVAAAGVLLVVALKLGLREGQSLSGIESIAVLPLENLSRDPDEEYFVDGMTEALITDLAKIGALQVISRTSVMQYKDARKPLREIARELDVDAVVEGSVLRVGDRVRITAQLIHAETDRHLWAESYERDLRDVLAVHSEVAQAIAREIEVKLTPQEKSRLATVRPLVPEAHEAYLRGRHYWNQRTEEGMRKALDYFQQAIEKDPGYAIAFSGLADSYTMLAFFGFAAPNEMGPRAWAAAMKALEIDETLAEAHASASTTWVFERDWKAGEEQLKKALELNPSYATAHSWYAHLLTALGRPEEAIARRRQAQRLDPFSPIISAAIGWDLYAAGFYDEATKQALKTLEAFPDFWIAQWVLGISYVQQGKLDEALDVLEHAAVSEENSNLIGALGHAAAVSGDRVRAIGILDQMLERSKTRYVSAYDIALVFQGLGDTEKTFEWLEKAYKERAGWLFMVNVEPRFSSLRSDPRFRDLVRRMNFPE